MTLERVPASIWRVNVTSDKTLTTTFTTRREARTYANTLYSSGTQRKSVSFDRFEVVAAT